MKKFTELRMPEWIKEPLMARHQFFVDQAQARLLSQFENLEADANRAGEEWLSRNDHRFDPDRHDPGDFYERAHDIGIEFYLSLCELHEQTRLNVVAGMFHHWDKELRGWISDEVRHWGKLKNFTDEVWASSFDSLMALLVTFGWNVRALPCFADLDACRWIVNVHKHGKGHALEKVRTLYPRFLLQSHPQIVGLLPSIGYRDHNDLTVTDADIITFSNAIQKFWKAVPPALDASTSTIALPRKFTDALEKDLKRQD